jgi:Ca2+-transporting ATPase
MGVRGTDVAKEAAAIVLQDDRFETIAAAVEEGRIVFDNIRRFVFFLFSCNLAEVLVLLVAGVVGLPAPMLPLQLLWLNLVTDTFPALALAMEAAEPDVMQRPPRPPDEAILSRAFLARIAVHAALITGATLAAFLWVLRHGVREAQTAAFMTVALAQIFHLGNARSRTPIFGRGRLAANGYAAAAVLAASSLQVGAAIVPPLPEVLRLAPLDATQWGVVVGAALIPLAAGQVLRAVDRRSGASSAPLRRHTPA